VKEAEGITDVPSLSWGERLTSSSVIAPVRKGFGHENNFFCLLFRQDTRKLTGKDIFFQAKGGITLIELILAFHFGFVFLGLEIHSALLCPCHVSALKQNLCTHGVLDP